MCKYGDFSLKLEISEKFGVYNVIPYSAYHIERQENFDPENPSKVVFNYNPEGIYGGSSSGYYNTPNQKQLILLHLIIMRLLTLDYYRM
jgi:hypothetical protein